MAGLCTIAWFLGSVPSLRFGWLREFVPFGYVALIAWFLLFLLDYFKVRRNLICAMETLGVQHENLEKEKTARAKAIESLYAEFYAFQRRVSDTGPTSSHPPA